jgi:chemotaxis protein MotA
MSVALKQKTALEVAEKEMALTGLLSLQAGDNKRIIAQKLDSFLTPAQRASIPEKGSSAAAASAAAEAA